MNDSTAPSLIDQAQTPLQDRRADDRAWIEVIQRMDVIYADLVNSQVELEKKNSALENAHLFIKSVVSSMSEILIVCDINGVIRETNPALSNCLGFNKKELTGKPLALLFEKNFQALIADFPQHIRSGSLIDCEVDLLNNQQQIVAMTINCSARFNHNNQLSGMVITGRPLGELRKAYSELNSAHEALKSTQQQLIQSEKMASLGRLVAGVAHELNNPISFVFANMYALQSYHDKFKSYIDAIHQDIDTNSRNKMRETLHIDQMMKDIAPLIEGSMEGAERVSNIVKDLKTFATPQKEKKQVLDIVALVKRATSWVIKATSAAVHLEQHSPDKLNITNSEGYIHQILINIIQNAIDAMAHKDTPTLTIHIKQNNAYVDIIIRDSGEGISEEHLDKIFEPFFTTKNIGSGTGLGLSISLGLASDQCGGKLQAKNHANGGAEFTLSLPLDGKHV